MFLAEPDEAFQESRPIGSPPQIHPAQQCFRGHGGLGSAARLIGIECATFSLNSVEISVGHLPSLIRHAQARGASGLQGHQLPTHDAGVALLSLWARLITPT